MKDEKTLRVVKQLESIEEDLGISDYENNADDYEQDYFSKAKGKLKKIKKFILRNRSDKNQKKINKKLKNISKLIIKEME